MDAVILSGTTLMNLINTTSVQVVDTIKTISLNNPKPGSAFQYFVGISHFFGVIATLLVAILAIWGEKFKPNPKLILVDHNLNGEFTILRPGDQRAIYYHLKIENLRKYLTAKNVKVFLIGIKRRLADNAYREYRMATNQQFINTPAEMTLISPSVKDFQILDFGRIVENENRFAPMLYITPNNFQGFVGPNESVRYLIKIVADNYYDSKIYEYEISWDGIWTDNIETMQNHLVVKRV